MESTLPDNDDEITIPAFELWVRTSRPGDTFIYHKGYLAIDREKVTQLPAHGYVHVFIEPYHTMAQVAWHHYERGDITLAQRKLPGQLGYDYIAFKRAKRR